MLGRLRTSIARKASTLVRARAAPRIRVAPAVSAMSWRLQEQKRFYAGGAHKLTEAEVTERVLNVVKGFDKVDPNKVSAAAHFANDLGLDSLDAVEVVMALEEEFCIEIPDAEAEKIVSTKDAITYIVTHPQAK